MNKILLWLTAIRPFSFTASTVPCVVGVLLSLYYPVTKNWLLFPLVWVCAILFHAGTNLISDYYDFEKKVDTKNSFGSSGVLLAGALPAKQIFWAGILCFGLGSLLGLFLVAERGENLFYIGLSGLLGGFFYCGKPIGYKYIALGDLFVFLLMGPLMVVGAFFSISAFPIQPREWFASIPIGLLVTAILHANNLRDIQHDSESGIKTLASLLGFRSSQFYYAGLVYGAYLSVVILVLFGHLSWLCLLVFISLPMAYKNNKQIFQGDVRQPEKLKTIDIQTAQNHFLFGILLSVGLLLAYLI